jgi:hypothetical protein
MQGKIFNFVSVSAAVGIVFLFATLWNLQQRDILYTHLEETEKSTPPPMEIPEELLIDNSTEIAELEPEPEPTRPSFLEIATKWGTDKVTTHHYNYSELVLSFNCSQTNKLHSVRKVPRTQSRPTLENARNWARMRYGLRPRQVLLHLA